MGRLGGFSCSEIVRKLKRLGFEFDRHAKGSHGTTIPNHPGDIPEGTLRAILRAGGVDVDQFLNS